ncbi:MAG: hypothetical protein ACFFHV_04655 [Promethearchaeota archaeon]
MKSKSTIVFGILLILFLPNLYLNSTTIKNNSNKQNESPISSDDVDSSENSQFSVIEDEKENWGYNEWKQYTIDLGYRDGQLNDEIINDPQIQNKIQIATILHWGLYNGTITKEESYEIARTKLTATTDGYIDPIYANDEQIKFEISFGIKGLECIYCAELYLSKDNFKDRVWKEVFFPWLCDKNVFDDKWTFIELDPIYIDTGYIEYNADAELVHWCTLFGVEYPVEDYIWNCYDITDDDVTPPEIRTWIYPSGHWNEKTELENNVIYDVSDISYSDSTYMKIAIEAKDPSGAQWRGKYSENNWFLFVPTNEHEGGKIGTYEFYLSDVYDTYPNFYLLEFGVCFRDNDHDRPNDYSSEVCFQFKLNRRLPWSLPLYGDLATVKIEGLDKKKGIYLNCDEYNSTNVYSFKEHHQKNEITISMEFKNTEEYPIRVKFGGLIPKMMGLDFTLLQNLDNIYRYNQSEEKDIYDGDLIDPMNLAESMDAIFTYDTKVDLKKDDFDFHFWVEINPGETKSIEICKISIKTLEILDTSGVIWDDWTKGIKDATELEAQFLNSRIFAQYVFAALGIPLPPTALDFIKTMENESKDIEDWLSLVYSADILGAKISNLGGFMGLFFGILEAYGAEKYWNDPSKWWWHLNEDVDDYHYIRGNPYNKWTNVRQMLIMDPEDWELVDSEDLIYYTGIGLIPDDSQRDALRNFISYEMFSDLMFSVSSMDYCPTFLLCLLTGIGVATDIYKDTAILDIVNGKDPPDNNYYEKPNVDVVSYPYERFPELYEEIQAHNSIAIQGKAIIDSLLDLERLTTNLIIANNRYNTAFASNNFSACSFQTQNIQEFSYEMIETSKQLEYYYVSFMNSIESETNNNPLYFSDIDMDILTSPEFEFEFDPKYKDFVTEFEITRNIETNVLKDMQNKEIAINSIEHKDMELLNEMAMRSSHIFESIDELCLSLLEENIKTNQYISVGKLGLSPLSGPEIELEINTLLDQLNTLTNLILNEEFYNASLLANIIKDSSLDLFFNTYRDEFLSIYYYAKSFERYALQKNQIQLTLVDVEKKVLYDGTNVNFSINIENLVGQILEDNYDYIVSTLVITNLPDYLTYSIFYSNDTELEKNEEGNYYILLSKNEVKSLKLQIALKSNSVPEISKEIKLQLIAYQNTTKKLMWSEASIELTILDDDITPPEILISEKGLGWVLEIEDNDGILDSIATGTYIILDNNDNIIFSGLLEENITYQLILPLKVGNYTLFVFATNNDKDWAGDEETSEASAMLEFTLDFLYDFVNSQIDELKDYIQANVSSCISRIFIHILDKTQERLQEAYYFIENGKCKCALFYDVIAQIYLKITEFKIELINRLNFINDENAEYMINFIHIIRNNIILLMGNSVGTEQGYSIALIEVDLLNLNDMIEEELNWCYCWCLSNYIRGAVTMLEISIFKISLDHDIKHFLTSASIKLDKAKCVINHLLDKGKISQELADRLLFEINQALDNIEILKN